MENDYQDELPTTRTETQLQDLLVQILDDATGGEAGTATFRQEGILTNNAGVVLTLPNGAEFQLTIVQSARPYGGADEGEEGDDK